MDQCYFFDAEPGVSLRLNTTQCPEVIGQQFYSRRHHFYFTEIAKEIIIWPFSYIYCLVIVFTLTVWTCLWVSDLRHATVILRGVLCEINFLQISDHVSMFFPQWEHTLELCFEALTRLNLPHRLFTGLHSREHSRSVPQPESAAPLCSLAAIDESASKPRL